MRSLSFHWENTQTEKAHHRFCKSCLSLITEERPILRRSEMVRFPLKVAIDKQFLKYFSRLRR